MEKKIIIKEKINGYKVFDMLNECKNGTLIINANDGYFGKSHIEIINTRDLIDDLLVVTED